MLQTYPLGFMETERSLVIPPKHSSLAISSTVFLESERRIVKEERRILEEGRRRVRKGKMVVTDLAVTLTYPEGHVQFSTHENPEDVSEITSVDMERLRLKAKG